MSDSGPIDDFGSFEEDSSEVESIQAKIDGLAYSVFGEYFEKKVKDGDFEYVDKGVRQSGRSIGTDLYLSRTLLYSLVLGFFGLLFGTAVVLILQVAGVLPNIDTGIRYPEPIAAVLWQIRWLIGALLFGIIGYSISTAIAFGVAMFWPSYEAGKRATRIDDTLPFAITFMYALSRGGMSFIEVLRVLDRSEDAYGEVAREVQPLVKDMDIFSHDMPTALHRATQRTPSDKFADFADDLQSTLDSGANITRFLKDKSEEYLELARREQENFIATLELMGEVYVTAFVAGPLFLIIITVVMTMLGGGAAVQQLYGIVYAMLPVMNIVFFLMIDFIAGSSADAADQINEDVGRAVPIEELEEASEALGGDEDIDNIIESKKSENRREFIRNPMDKMIRNPEYSLAFSGPAAVIFLIFSLVSGFGVISFDAFVADPVMNTAALFTIPFMITIIPYTVLYELKARREKKMMNRIPDALKQLASANAIGMTLTESMKTVSANTGGVLGTELNYVSNDISWKHDVNGALIRFANRVRMPVITRTVKLITKANQSSGDIEDVLSVAANDVAERQKLQKKQSQAMMMYTVVILISFAVYLFVIAMLDSTFLQRIAELGEDGGAGGDMDMQEGGGGGMGAADLTDLPVDQFRMIFFHSTIIQAIGSGLLAGKLGSNDVRKGLKFTIILVTISSIMFYFL